MILLKMINIFTIYLAVKSESLNSNSVISLYKQNMMLNFVDIYTNNPRMTPKQVSKHLDFSDRTIKRCRDDIQKDRLYNRNNYKK